MVAPFYSTFALFTEIIITIAVLYIFYSGYKHNKFPYKLAVFAITYEILFNISYMLYRTFVHTIEDIHSTFEIGLAIFHGAIALMMFIALVVFLIFAYKAYRRHINYFSHHKTLTIIFLIFWLISVLSGILFYFVAYS